MHGRHMTILLVTAVCLFLTCTAAFGNNIKERMKQRLPVIVDLKTKGIIGEGNNGYLGFVGARRASEDVVAAENKDRKAVYSFFAKQQGTSLDVVEKIQADRKAEIAKSGEYIQKSDGAWIKK